jgi:hypothetical protein
MDIGTLEDWWTVTSNSVPGSCAVIAVFHAFLTSNMKLTNQLLQATSDFEKNAVAYPWRQEGAR